MCRLSIALWFCAAGSAASLHFQASGFSAGPDGKPVLLEDVMTSQRAAALAVVVHGC